MNVSRLQSMPYVGVAGFMDELEIMAAISTLRNMPPRRHLLAIGILTSAKTIRGIPNKYPTRYPNVSVIPDMVRRAIRSCQDVRSAVQFILHYAAEPGDIEAQLALVRDLVKTAGFDGVQLNGSPHLFASTEFCRALHALDKFHDSGKRLILQIKSARAPEPPIDLVAVALRASQEMTITDLLIDASGGAGIHLQEQFATHIIAGVRNGYCAPGMWIGRERFTIGVAGGLGPGRFDVVRQLAALHGPLSWDMESGVRGAEDRMSTELLTDALKESWDISGPA